MQTFVQNLRFALRQLRKSPGFALTVVAHAGARHRCERSHLHTLRSGAAAHVAGRAAEGVGALRVDGRLLRFGQQLRRRFDQLLLLSHVQGPARPEPGLYRGCSPRTEPASASPGTTRPKTKTPRLVSGNYFDLLGLKPALGRLMNAAGRDREECESSPGPQLRLLEDALCSIARCRRPDGAHQRPSLHHPGRRPAELQVRDRRLQARRIYTAQHG